MKTNNHDILDKNQTYFIHKYAQLTTTMAQCGFTGGLGPILHTKRSLSSVIEPHRSRSVPGNKANCQAK